MMRTTVLNLLIGWLSDRERTEFRKWMDGWTDGWMDGQMHELMDE